MLDAHLVPHTPPPFFEGKCLIAVGRDLGQLFTITLHPFARINCRFCPQIHSLQREAFQMSGVWKRILPVQDSRCPQDATLTGEGAQNLQDQMLKSLWATRTLATLPPPPEEPEAEGDSGGQREGRLGLPPTPTMSPGSRHTRHYRAPPGAVTLTARAAPPGRGLTLGQKAVLTWRKGNCIKKRTKVPWRRSGASHRSITFSIVILYVFFIIFFL